MKYKKQVALALLCFATQGHGNHEYSKTFFTAIPQHKLITNLTQNLLVDQAHSNGRVLKKRTVQVALFGGKSGQPENLRDYFLFDGKNGLLVKESPTQQNGNNIGTTQDLIASDFNIQTNSNGKDAGSGQTSTININPSQTVSGAAISFRAPVLDRAWFSIDMPIVHVKNDLDFTETFSYLPIAAIAGGNIGFFNELTQQPSVPVNSMTAAFNQPGMFYGKINGAQTRTRIADMTFKFGYDFVDQTDFYLSGYAGMVFPTGNKPQGVYMFEAIVGNNKHFGLNGGMYGQLSFENFGHNNLWLGWSFEGEYLFANTQTRSFDLKNRPWSRYMQVFRNVTDQFLEDHAGVVPYRRTWGINYFTQEVKVHAGYNGSFNVNLNYVGDAWHSGLGFNTYVRQAEDVQLKNRWNLGPQLAALPFYGDGDAGFIQPLRTMSVLPNANTAYSPDNGPVYVQESDLNLLSAAHPAVYSQTVYSSLGYYRPSEHYPQDFELGASYEYGSCNTVLNRWTIWTRFQITF